jgi:hypothetical protein
LKAPSQSSKPLFTPKEKKIPPPQTKLKKKLLTTLLQTFHDPHIFRNYSLIIIANDKISIQVCFSFCLGNLHRWQPDRITMMNDAVISLEIARNL